MKRRVIYFAVMGLAVAAMLYAVTEAVWFHATLPLYDIDIEIGLGRVIDDGRLSVSSVAYMIACVVCGLSTIYFAVRFGAAAFTMLAGRPLNRRVAWLSPTGAQIQGGIVLALALVALFVPPELEVKDLRGVDLGFTMTRSYGGFLLVGGLAAAQVIFMMIRSDLELSASQGWLTDDDIAAILAAREQAATAEQAARPRERPMVKPPLTAPAAVDADPFRAPPVAAVRTVPTATAPKPAPVVEGGADAPKPSMLN